MMIEPTAMVALTGFLGAGGATIIIKLLDIMQERHKEKKDRENGVLSLDEKIDSISTRQDAIAEQLTKTDQVVLASARDRIIYLCRSKTEAGLFTLDDLKEIEDIYFPYHDDGGNHSAQDAYELYREQVMEFQKSQVKGDKQ